MVGAALRVVVMRVGGAVVETMTLLRATGGTDGTKASPVKMMAVAVTARVSDARRERRTIINYLFALSLF